MGFLHDWQFISVGYQFWDPNIASDGWISGQVAWVCLTGGRQPEMGQAGWDCPCNSRVSAHCYIILIYMILQVTVSTSFK